MTLLPRMIKLVYKFTFSMSLLSKQFVIIYFHIYLFIIKIIYIPACKYNTFWTSSIGHLKKTKCSPTINCMLNPTLLRGRLGGSDQWSHSWALRWRVFGPQLGLSGGELDEPFGSSSSTSFSGTYTVYWCFSLYTELVPASILTCSTKYVRYQVGI